MEVHTERLLLRQWREADFEEYARIYEDETHARFIGGQMPRPKAWRHMAALVGHWGLRGYGVWAVEELATSTFVGAIGLWRPDGWPELELGYWLVPEAYGKGYASEAGAASRDFAFESLNADTLVSYIDPDNRPSIKVAERLGAYYDRSIELLDLGTHLVYRYSRK